MQSKKMKASVRPKPPRPGQPRWNRGQPRTRLTMKTLLERSGFRIRNAKRADCAYCSGHSTATVSYTNEVAYCHRCHWTANVVTLACQLGLAKPINQWTPAERRSEQQRREREAQVRAFEAWLKAKTGEVLAELHRQMRQEREAGQALARNPCDERAWDQLADSYGHRARTNQTLDYLMGLKLSLWLEDDATVLDVFRSWCELGCPAAPPDPRGGRPLAPIRPLEEFL